MNGNPFYVHPGGDYSQGLAGLSATLEDVRKFKAEEADKQRMKERFTEIQGAMTEAWRSNDPDKMAEVAIAYPEAKQTVEMMFGFYKDREGREPTKPIVTETYRNVLTDRDNAVDYLENGIGQVYEVTGEVPQNMLTDLGMLRNNPEAFFQKAEMGLAAMAPDEYTAYKGGKKEGLPAAVQETEWFLAQTPEIQEQHLKVKRKEDPTLAHKLEEAQKRADIAVDELRRKKEAESTVTTIDETVGKIMELEGGLSKYDSLIEEIDKGATTSVFTSWAPSIKDETRRFQQTARELGLGVISNTTFGALSEGEMRLAMQTAVPELTPPAMRQWLQDKKSAQQKLADEMYRFAEFLNDGGTKVEWLREQRRLKKERAEANDEHAVLPEGVTEDDIQTTMRIHNLTREQVLERIRGQ